MTAVGEFAVPSTLIKAEYINELAHLLEEHVKADSEASTFTEALCLRFSLEQKRDTRDISIALELFLQIRGLERKRVNGIWTRIIKNAFAPVFQRQFDYIAGNPPWINWANLPDEYRQRTVSLWTKYRLFEHKGLRAKLGAAMDDLSVLMLYVAADRYLKASGKLGFVITQSVFKTAGGGEGFRRLQLGSSEHLKVLHVDDLSRVQCFEGAANRASLLFLRKGEPTRYPVPYTYWRKKPGRGIPPESDFEEAMSLLDRVEWIARPIDTKKKNSPWISGGERALGKISNVTGPSQYQGRHGSHTHLSGVYWLEVISTRKDGLLLITNLHTSGKIQVRNVNMAVEPDFVFPLLRGRDVRKWSARPQCAILLPQDPDDPAKAYPVTEMQKHYPRTFAYLRESEDRLRQRSGFKQFFDTKTAPFYSVYNVGPYTYNRFKAVWREQASVLTAAVAISPAQGNPIVPDHKLMLCTGGSEAEVHYICAFLNSVIAQFIVKSYGLETSISSHIFNYLSIRQFDPQNDLHRELALNSRQLHAATSKDDQETVRLLETTNMELAGQLGPKSI